MLEADYANGACDWNNRYPADRKDNGESSCALSRDQIHIGEWLTKATHIQIVSAEAEVPAGAKACELPIFGYRVMFSENRVESTHRQALNGELIRMWDITMPSTESEVLWHGCARRNISGYVPRFTQRSVRGFLFLYRFFFTTATLLLTANLTAPTPIDSSPSVSWPVKTDSLTQTIPSAAYPHWLF